VSKQLRHFLLWLLPDIDNKCQNERRLQCPRRLDRCCHKLSNNSRTFDIDGGNAHAMCDASKDFEAKTSKLNCSRQLDYFRSNTTLQPLVERIRWQGLHDEWRSQRLETGIISRPNA